MIKAALGLRVSQEEEINGLDIGEHGMEAYAGFQVTTTDYSTMHMADSAGALGEYAKAPRPAK